MILQYISLLNLVLAFMNWKWSKESFQEGHNFSGWFNLFASAFNVAIFAHIFTRGQ